MLRVWEAAAFWKFQDSWYWGNSSFAATMWYSTRQLLLKASWLTYRQVPPPLWVKRHIEWTSQYYIYIYYISWVLAVSGRGNDSDSELATHPLQFFLASRVANGLWMPQKVAEADQVHGTFSHDSQVWFDFIYIERESISILLITCDSCQELSTTADHPVATPAHWSWGPVQCFSWQSLPCVNTYGPCGRRNPSERIGSQDLARIVSEAHNLLEFGSCLMLPASFWLGLFWLWIFEPF